MTQELKNRIAKIYELLKNGGTEGEKQAANLALDRILKKYDLEGINLETINQEEYEFTYTTEMELWLFQRVIRFFAQDFNSKMYKGQKRISVQLTYMDWVTVSCSYEYFRRHMKAQWNLVCADELKRKRKVKTKNERRKELQKLFFSRYVIASKLYQPHELVSKEVTAKKEVRDNNMMDDVQGGAYNKQVVNGLQITEGTKKVEDKGQLNLF
jgi:hypothetical protein